MLEVLLSQMGLKFITKGLSKILNTIDSDTAKTAAKSLDAVSDSIARGEISPDQLAEANRHIESMAEKDVKALGEINQSLRAEVTSDDKYVRRMRPTFGYFMAVTWAAQMFGVAYIMVFETDKASVVINAVESLSAIWAIGLSVLGIYVYKRSEDKKRIYSINSDSI